MGTTGQIGDERQLRQALDDISRRVAGAIDNDEVIDATRRLLIRSPNGHYWSIGASDAGAITLTDMGISL